MEAQNCLMMVRVAVKMEAQNEKKKIIISTAEKKKRK
jgi:hypothetical protein